MRQGLICNLVLRGLILCSTALKCSDPKPYWFPKCQYIHSGCRCASGYITLAKCKDRYWEYSYDNDSAKDSYEIHVLYHLDSDIGHLLISAKINPLVVDIIKNEYANRRGAECVFVIATKEFNNYRIHKNAWIYINRGLH